MTPRGYLAVVLAVGVVALGVFAAMWLVWTAPPTPPDYAQESAWLCRPGRADACSAPLTASVVEADGARHVVTTRPDPAAPIDCFYVYPTVSRAKTAYSPIAETVQEHGIARGQLARFSTACRPFAPLYRQITLRGLPALFAGLPRVNRETPYADVLAAWRRYLAKDNGGRPVVLIGHSQGARLLARLIAAEIDGKPVQQRLVVAILPGTEIDVPTGRDIGGTFKAIPLCSPGDGRRGACIIAYSSYPAGRPVPAEARFGRPRDAGGASGMTYACVDPAVVAGSSHLDPVLPLRGELEMKLGTDFVELPGALSARCRDDGGASVLEVDAGQDARLGESTNALIERLAQYRPTDGLHGFDINLAEGTLVNLVRQRTSFYVHH